MCGPTSQGQADGEADFCRTPSHPWTRSYIPTDKDIICASHSKRECGPLVQRARQGSGWWSHGSLSWALSSDPSLVLVLWPVSRVCFNSYFNFVLAERHCQIVPFKGNSYFGGLLESLCFWLRAAQDLRGTHWLPQTVLHAVLTVPREGSKTRCPGVSAPLEKPSQPWVGAPCWQKPCSGDRRALSLTVTAQRHTDPVKELHRNLMHTPYLTFAEYQFFTSKNYLLVKIFLTYFG